MINDNAYIIQKFLTYPIGKNYSITGNLYSIDSKLYSFNYDFIIAKKHKKIIFINDNYEVKNLTTLALEYGFDIVFLPEFIMIMLEDENINKDIILNVLNKMLIGHKKGVTQKLRNKNIDKFNSIITNIIKFYKVYNLDTREIEKLRIK